MLLVWLSWRLISAIECDNSSAATAAVSTLVDASWKACTALSARCEVCSEEPNNAAAVERMAAALSLTLASSFSTCGRNDRIDVSTLTRRWILLLGHGAFFFRLALLGDVLVGGHPAAVRQRLVFGEDDAAVAGLHINRPAFAFRDAVADLFAICIDIAGEQSGFLAMRDQLL